jgi:hypothetical protein
MIPHKYTLTGSGRGATYFCKNLEKIAAEQLLWEMHVRITIGFGSSYNAICHQILCPEFT